MKIKPSNQSAAANYTPEGSDPNSSKYGILEQVGRSHWYEVMSLHRWMLPVYPISKSYNWLGFVFLFFFYLFIYSMIYSNCVRMPGTHLSLCCLFYFLAISCTPKPKYFVMSALFLHGNIAEYVLYTHCTFLPE